MRNLISILLAACVLTIFLMGCGSQQKGKDVTLEQMESDMNEFIQLINSSCPLYVDSITRIDSLTFESTRNVVVYHNTLRAELSADDSSVQVFRLVSQKNLPIDYRNSEGYTPFRTLKIGVEMYYHDSRGNYLFRASSHP